MEGWKRAGYQLEISSIVLLIVGLFLTCVATFYVYWNVQREDTTRFNDLDNQVVQEILNRIENYSNLLIQARGLFVSHHAHAVTRREFREYIKNMNLQNLLPGIQGVGFTPRLAPKEVFSFTQKVRNEGFPKFKVWPSNRRPEYFPVEFIEPFDWRNQRAFGFDMFTDSIRREAMERAWLSGAPSLTGRVKLVQETSHEQEPGFLLYVPVYKSGAKISTEQDRKMALIGFVYSPFRSAMMFRSLFAGQHLPIDFEVYDGSEPSAQVLLYDKDGQMRYPGKSSAPRFQKLTRIEVAGRTWSIYTSTESTFVLPTARFAPLVSALAGLVITFLLFRTFLVSARHGYALENMVEAEQDARKQSEASLSVLETLNRVSANISAELDLKKLVQNVTDAATSLSHAQVGAFFFNVLDQSGKSYALYAFSGASGESVMNLIMPEHSAAFDQIFDGNGSVRSEDMRRDPRFESRSASEELAKDSFPVASYLAVPVVSRGGEVIGGLFFGHEKAGVFTEREEKVVVGLAAQAAVAIDNARLYLRSKEAISVRDEFLSICSHELKTPLTTLKLQTQLNRRKAVKQEGLSTQSFIGLLSTTERQVDRLSRLVDDMLDVSRIATGRLKITMEAFDLADVVREVAERLTPQAESAGSRLQLEIGTSIMGQWDRLRIDQVVTNLITNAVKYGAGQPIRLSLTETAGEAKLLVRDEGMGIAPEHQKRIFERFERVTEDSGISGLGLGLYITRQILEAHGGTIQVESDIGRGATFIVTLPVSKSQLRHAS
jgi:signal transduction histidine kinase/CHASE1-domain containing sensor protein